jgi:hypothetical protein
MEATPHQHVPTLAAMPCQPWKPIVTEAKASNFPLNSIADTDTFKRGEAIVIGGQSNWGKKEDGAPTPSAKRLWYDTEEVKE